MEDTATQTFDNSSNEISGGQVSNPFNADGASQTAEESYDWNSDKRYKEMWKEDPNNLYKSYRNLEKSYQPLQQNLSKYNSVLHKYGYSPEKLEDFEKDIGNYKNPDSPYNKSLSYFNNWLGNEKYQGKVVDFFSNLETEEKRARYGENIPDEVMNKLEEFDQMKAHFQQQEQAQQRQQEVNQHTQVISTQLSEVEQIAKEYNVDFNDQTKAQLLQHCAQNNIDPKYISSVFAKHALEAVKKATSYKAEQNVIKNISKNKGMGISSAGTKSNTTSNTASNDWRSNLESAVSKYF